MGAAYGLNQIKFIQLILSFRFILFIIVCNPPTCSTFEPLSQSYSLMIELSRDLPDTVKISEFQHATCGVKDPNSHLPLLFCDE